MQQKDKKALLAVRSLCSSIMKREYEYTVDRWVGSMENFPNNLDFEANHDEKGRPRFVSVQRIFSDARGDAYEVVLVFDYTKFPGCPLYRINREVWGNYDHIISEVETMVRRVGITQASIRAEVLRGEVYTDNCYILMQDGSVIDNLFHSGETLNEGWDAEVSDSGNKRFQKIESYFNQTFRIVFPKDKWLAFKIDYVNLAIMYWQGDPQETLRFNITILDGFVPFGFGEDEIYLPLSFLRDHMDGLNNNNKLPTAYKVKSYLQQKTRIMGFEYISIDQIKLADETNS